MATQKDTGGSDSGGGIMIDDMYSLLAKVREWELAAHNRAHCGSPYQRDYIEAEASEKAYKRVADYIENNPKQLHRRLDGE